MQKTIMVITAAVLWFGAVTSVFAQSAKYDFIINRDIPYLTSDVISELEKMPAKPGDTEQRLYKGFLILERALRDTTPETAQTAYDYFLNTYDTDQKLHNPVFNAYVGSAQALVGGTLKNPVQKISFLTGGIERIDEAVAALEKTNDVYALGFVYFLRANVLARVPSFMKISKQAPDAFKKALHNFKKGKIQNGNLLSDLYRAYATYYTGQGKIRNAQKSLQVAFKFATTPDAKKFVKQELDKIQ